MRFLLSFLSLIFVGFAKPIISVSIPPQAYFLAQIAGDSININTLIPQGSDPHTFEFKPSMLATLQKSDLYLTIGLEFERQWIPKLKLSNTKILSINSSISNHCTHSHKNHNHHSCDPHIWLSPKIVKILSKNIAQILISQYPQNKSLYEKNLKTFLERIDSLHADLSAKLKHLKNRSFITYHPAWEYFAKDYNLKEISIEFEGKEPTPKILNQTLQIIKQNKIKTIFVQNGFSQKSASIIAKDSKATIWITDPLAYEWEKELLNFAQGLLQ